MKVEVQRQGRRFEAQARFVTPADVISVWRTITDYEALPRFMPGIHDCRVVSRSALPGGERLQVEQRGVFRFLVFEQRLTVQLEIVHEGTRLAAARALNFELGVLKGRALEAFAARYELAPAGEGTELRYTASITSRLPPPPGIGTAAVRANLLEQLQAVAGEIARRRAAAARHA